MTHPRDPATIQPGAEAVLEARALALVIARGRRGATVEELARSLEPRPEPAALRRALERLETGAEVVLLDDHWVALQRTELAIGTLEVLSGGDGRLHSPDQRGAPSHFIARRHLHGALPGDRVLVEPVGSRSSKEEGDSQRESRSQRSRGRRLRGDRRPAERPVGRQGGRQGELPRAAVLRVLGAPRLLVGKVSQAVSLVPFDARLPFEVILEKGSAGSSERAVQVGEYLHVELRRGRRPDSLPRGRLVERLGTLSDPGTDGRVILRHFEIPDTFPAAALAEAERLPQRPSRREMEGRLDLRGQTIFTIDGESARDFDDAVSWQDLGQGRHRLGIHIASVASYVKPGSALDLEAYRRGTSVYFPEGAVPMLPERLSNGLCSLRPNEPRLTLSVFLDVDAAGTVIGSRFAESVIESVQRLTYEQARRILEEDDCDERRSCAEVVPALEGLERVSRTLAEARRRQGSLEFDLPLADLVLDESGQMAAVRTSRRNVAHRIIEELMIAANRAVARTLATAGADCLFRVHEPPRLRSLKELAQSLRLFGLDLDIEGAAESPLALRALLLQVAGRQEEDFVAGVVLRSLQRAVYLPENRGHYALAAECYLHFTSPIRRYPDLLAHRALVRWIRQGQGQGQSQGRQLGGEAEATRSAEDELRLERMAQLTSSTERRAERAERQLRQWKLVRFLATRIGESFTGRVTGVEKFGLFVRLEEVQVDGLLHVANMGEDYFVFEPEGHRLTGEHSRRTYRLGDRVEVRLLAVDERRRGLDFALIDAVELPDRAGSRKGKTMRRRRRNPTSR